MTKGLFIVVGAGVAGLSAAVSAAEQGYRCVLVSSGHSRSAGSVLDTDGIFSVSMDSEEEFERHVADTLEAGVGLCSERIVRNMAYNGLSILKWLHGFGMPLQQMSGVSVVSALDLAVSGYEARGLITRWNHHTFAQLMVSSEKTCTGCVVRDDFTGEFFALEGPVLLCCGGQDRFFGRFSSGTMQNTGNGVATVFRQGVTVGNPEFLLFSDLSYGTGGKRVSVPERVLQEGAAVQQKGDNFLLDMTALSGRVWKERFPGLRKQIQHDLGVDPKKQTFPVVSSVKTCLGGVLVDGYARSSMPGLYAAGECACDVHGAGMLPGNGLLGALYGGRNAALQLVKQEDFDETARPHRIARDALFHYAGAPFYNNPADRLAERELNRALAEGLGPLRDATGFQQGLSRLESLGVREELSSIQKTRLLYAEAMLRAGFAREESRGVHVRLDFPVADDTLAKNTAVTYRGRKIITEFREVDGHA